MTAGDANWGMLELYKEQLNELKELKKGIRAMNELLEVLVALYSIDRATAIAIASKECEIAETIEEVEET